MVQDPQNEASGEDQWMVAIAPGNVQMMDVEQLDAAYQAGQINDHTMVWTQGMDAWLPLSQVIGGEAEAEPVAAAVPVSQRPDPAPAAVTQQLGGQLEVQQQVDATQRAWQEQADAAAAAAFAAAQQAPVHPAPAVLAPSAFAAAASQANGGAQGFAASNALPGAFAGGTPAHQMFVQAQPANFGQPVFAPSVASPSSFPSVAAPGAPGPSTAPMALNLDSLDLSSIDMPKKKSKLGLIAAAALVLGAGGVTAMNLGGGSSTEKAPGTVVAAAGAVEGADKPLAKNDPNAPLDMGGSYEVTEAEKKAFAKEAEQQQEMRDKMAAALTGPNGEKADTSGKGAAAPSAAAAKGAMKAKFGGGGGATKKSKGGGGSGLSKGGSSFDPLNGDL